MYCCLFGWRNDEGYARFDEFEGNLCVTTYSQRNLEKRMLDKSGYTRFDQFEVTINNEGYARFDRFKTANRKGKRVRPFQGV